MRNNSLTSGAVALLCLAGLARVIGQVRDLAAPTAQASAHARLPETMGHLLWGGGFLVVGSTTHDVIVQSGPTRAAQMLTARQVRDCLGDRLAPEPGCRVQIRRPDGPTVVTCGADAGEWRLRWNGPCRGCPGTAHSTGSRTLRPVWPRGPRR